MFKDLPNLSDTQLTAIYKKANNQAEGKAHPITTVAIFKAMRAMVKVTLDMMREDCVRDSVTDNVPHTLAGFRGAFFAQHNRTPTDQEVWQAAIRSYKHLNDRKKDAINQALNTPDNEQETKETNSASNS